MIIRSEVPASLFERMQEQTQVAVTETENPGDDLPARVPALLELLADPSLRGALASILGPTHRMSATRRCHLVPPPPSGSSPKWHVTNEYPLHKDGGNNVPQARHRCRRLMVIFFPGECTPDMGPTMIAPGAQYYAQVDAAMCFDTRQTGGPAGHIAVVHYDTWHGGTCNYSNNIRYMMKFLFERMDEPTEPSWNCADTVWRQPQRGPSLREHPDLWRMMWNWHCGADHSADFASCSARGDIKELVESLSHEDEAVCLDSAYALGAIGAATVPLLLIKLAEESACSPRVPINIGHLMGGNPAELSYAAFALATIGAPAVPGLIELLQYEDWPVRAMAADTLFEMGPPGGGAAPALCVALRDRSVEVRLRAGQALGTIRPPADLVAPSLIEPLKQTETGDERSGIARACMIGALARNVPSPGIALPAFVEAIRDENRDVRYYAAAGLERLGTAESLRALDEFYATRPNERQDAA